MDPVTLIVTALAAGAAAGGKGVADKAIKDAYAALKALAKRRLAGRTAGEVALEQYETKPEQWAPALESELVEVKAPADPALIEAARTLMALVDSAGSQAGKYVVNAPGMQGGQIGDHNTQTNTFNNPPPATT